MEENNNIPLREDTPRSKGLDIAANILSGVFLPLLVPTYTYATALWITPLSIIPERQRLLSSLVIFAITAMIPLATILFMASRGLISDASVSDRRQRPVPLLVTMLCYFAAGIYLRHMPWFLPTFFIGAGMATGLAMIITLWWKISAHCMAMGGLCSMLIYIGLTHISTVFIIPWIGAGILLSGMVGSARIYLGRHTPAQVYCGWLLGLAVTMLTVAVTVPLP